MDVSAVCPIHRPPVAAGTLAFSSGQSNYDAAYQKAVGVISQDTVNGKFIAGASWSSVWTRDTSYSIDLGAGLLEPTVASTTLMGMTETDTGAPGSPLVWVQDGSGDFGGWPNLSDSIVGAQGAWSLYLTTGDMQLLSWAYDITLNSLARAERDVFKADAGLFGGCSSFMESNSGYPKKYMNNGSLLAQTKALSTNILYYRGYDLAAKMGTILGKDVSALQTKGATLKAQINSRLWLPSAGYYAYFEDENGVAQQTMEGTGESFAILWGVADASQTQSILASMYETSWGVPCLWPRYPEWEDYTAGFPQYYHNGMIWPFVGGYWGWASAVTGTSTRFATELDRIRALGEKTATFQEYYHPEDGAPDGSQSQLWSASGYLSMVYHGLVGMSFDPNGVTFAPVVPSTFQQITLDGISYRQMTLNVSVTGSGTTIGRFVVDGVDQASHTIDGSLTGTHRVDIVLGPC